MNPEIKAEWLTALRSGEYKQGKNALKRTDEWSGEVSHCCLGVLCELALEAGVEVKMENPSEAGYIEKWEFDGSAETLPLSVMEWAGMENDLGRLNDGDFHYNDNKYESLADMNDQNVPFTEIADVIETEF